MQRTVYVYFVPIFPVVSTKLSSAVSPIPVQPPEPVLRNTRYFTAPFTLFQEILTPLYALAAVSAGADRYTTALPAGLKLLV